MDMDMDWDTQPTWEGNRVPQNTSITKIGKVGHVLSTIVVTRVDLANLIFLEDLHFTSNLESYFSSILGFNKALKITTISLVWDPHALL